MATMITTGTITESSRATAARIRIGPSDPPQHLRPESA